MAVDNASKLQSPEPPENRRHVEATVNGQRKTWDHPAITMTIIPDPDSSPGSIKGRDECNGRASVQSWTRDEGGVAFVSCIRAVMVSSWTLCWGVNDQSCATLVAGAIQRGKIASDVVESDGDMLDRHCASKRGIACKIKHKYSGALSRSFSSLSFSSSFS